MKERQKVQKNPKNTTNRLLKMKSSSGRENSGYTNDSNDDLMMDKFKEIEKCIEKEMTMIRDKQRTEEKEIQLRKDKLEMMEMEIERKRAEIAEKLLLTDQRLADMQSKMFKKEARNTKVLQTFEERIGEVERASVERDDRLKLLMKGPTRLDSVGEEKEDREY